ncbi:MAG: hydantoinase/oxoprolinase family protein [Desulfonatronovibrionaceae bacterium]
MTACKTSIIGIDTGGTFTDFIYQKNGTWQVHKILSTPDDPSRAVLEGLEHISSDLNCTIVHGTTVATNAILERKGVKTALITNKGFEDIIEIRRQNRLELYNLFYSGPDEIVPRELRFGIKGRINAQGREIQPLDTDGLKQAARQLSSLGVESIAVCLLFSYLDPSHEKQVAEEFQDLSVHVSLSHKILPEFREFERMSTTVVNAGVSPRMSGYLHRIKKNVHPAPLRIMQSNGGSISVDTAMEESVRTILSGPAGGVVGALETGRRAGFDKLITFDMGGTSTDVCLIDQRLPLTTETVIAGHPLKVPMLDIHTVGAGGGSLVRIDAGGSLRTGPESAGADPGPVCYGKGRQLTITDANLFLNRLIPERFLNGKIRLVTDRLHLAFQELSSRAGLDPVRLAEGILAVANAGMERAIRVISVEKGFDPREFTLFSFGGAGGLHCVFLAEMLSIPRVLVPRNPGILSAMGMVMSHVIKDYSRTVMLPVKDLAAENLEKMFVVMQKQAEKDMQAQGFSPEQVNNRLFLDMRYQGQSFEIMVPFSKEFIQNFETVHKQKYGYNHSSRGMEIVNLRLRCLASPVRPEPEKIPAGRKKPEPEAVVQEKRVIFNGQALPSRVIDRDRLLAGNEFSGPAVVVEYSSTIVVPPAARARVDVYGNLLLDTGK